MTRDNKHTNRGRPKLFVCLIPLFQGSPKRSQTNFAWWPDKNGEPTEANLATYVAEYNQGVPLALEQQLKVGSAVIREDDPVEGPVVVEWAWA